MKRVIHALSKCDFNLLLYNTESLYRRYCRTAIPFIPGSFLYSVKSPEVPMEARRRILAT